MRRAEAIRLEHEESKEQQQFQDRISAPAFSAPHPVEVAIPPDPTPGTPAAFDRMLKPEKGVQAGEGIELMPAEAPAPAPAPAQSHHQDSDLEDPSGALGRRLTGHVDGARGVVPTRVSTPS